MDPEPHPSRRGGPTEELMQGAQGTAGPPPSSET